MTEASALVYARARDSAAGWVHRYLVRSIVPRPWLGLEKIGTTYGGWIVPTAMVQPRWICYCAGVGEDASFDLGLIERFGCRVFAFDPTPRAIAFAAPIQEAEPRFKLVPVGVWTEDVTLRFYAPRDPAHVSHSVLNLQGTDRFFAAPCRSLESLMTELGHDHVDLLKLDIEGAEHAVLRGLLVTGPRPTVVCTEIDRPVGPGRVWRTVRGLRRGGYGPVAADAWNLTFIRSDRVPDRGAISG